MLVWKARYEALHQDIEFCLSLAAIDARSELAKYVEPEGIAHVDAIASPHLLVHSQGNPDIGTQPGLASLKAFRGDANNG